MLKWFSIAVVLLLCGIPSFAQYGTAPQGGYFPASYNGDIFTGTVTAAEGDQLTLTYTKGSKTDTFYRMFGDKQGTSTSASVGASSGTAFGNDYQSSTNYDPYFDYNSTGSIGTVAGAQFGNHYQNTTTYLWTGFTATLVG